MLITCPNCQTAYEVEDARLGPSGRSVRCAQCGERWLARPPAVLAVAASEAAGEDAAPPAQEPEFFPWAAPSELETEAEAEVSAKDLPAVLEAPPLAHDIETAASHQRLAAASLIEAETDGFASALGERTPQPEILPRTGRARSGASQSSRRVGLALAAAILVFAAAIAGLIAGRTKVVRLAPQTARVFAAIGFPVNLRGLLFEDVKLGYETAEGVPVLVVEGFIANPTRRDAEVPRLRFAVRNRDRLETYAWTALPAAPALAPGERLPFRTRLASPPPETQDVLVRFHHRRDLAGAD